MLVRVCFCRLIFCQTVRPVCVCVCSVTSKLHRTAPFLVILTLCLWVKAKRRAARQPGRSVSLNCGTDVQHKRCQSETNSDLNAKVLFKQFDQTNQRRVYRQGVRHATNTSFTPGIKIQGFYFPELSGTHSTTSYVIERKRNE